MGTATGFYGRDAGGRESVVGVQEVCVFAGEDVICDRGDGVPSAQREAELEHEGGFAGTDGAFG